MIHLEHHMKLENIYHWYTASGALVAELPPEAGLESLMKGLASLGGLVCFDSSSAAHGHLGSGAEGEQIEGDYSLDRFSFVAADPIESFVVPSCAKPEDAESIREIVRTMKSRLASFSCQTIPGLPPFQGGLAGMLSFDAGLALLGVEYKKGMRSEIPLVQFGLYDVVFAFDHKLRKVWAISQGVPCSTPAERRSRSRERLEKHLCAAEGSQSTSSESLLVPAGQTASAHLYPLPGSDGVFSTHSSSTYANMVQSGIDLVRAGDIFQVNLAQQFSVAGACNPLELYKKARVCNPAPFAGYLDFGNAAIVSMSPERFLKVTRGSVSMHPIKGTRRVLSRPEADLYASADLHSSEKDRAENVMIVDLVRNDLSRVCEPKSVIVEALCRLERFRYVQHLVSVVSGRLVVGASALDAVLAAFPGGSITGAPKYRACEIICQLEENERGPYCGTLGYVGFDGNADLNILIRTFVVHADSITFSAGGGVTVGSDPAMEYAESLHKAEGMLSAFEATVSGGST